ncbi:MAG: [FeFe] hydrogenase H-cluster radical SAM maturase HydE [Treponemataceae bacterium]|nr:[FeFe] hydrogenase H-cluster radical SAM maturase HydE [Treponemataceae bacterium]
MKDEKLFYPPYPRRAFLSGTAHDDEEETVQERQLPPVDVPSPWDTKALREAARLPLSELGRLARDLTDRIHGKAVLLRGLIEVTNYCAMNCLYCGIRHDNLRVRRYRLSFETLTQVIREGRRSGFKTFVLQGGEDPALKGEGLLRLTELARTAAGPEAALTLSFGIRSRREYEELRAAGADRYLLRFETADPELHRRLRNGIPLRRRLRALEDIRAAGLQLGSGFMVGLPGETEETLLRNVFLAQELQMDMGGVGPFIPHPETPLAAETGGTIEQTLRATALLRLALPLCHIPATTAAGSIHPEGREMVLAAGANVLMPNITPVEHKKDYALYPGKICVDESGLSCVGCLARRVQSRGLELSWARGDAPRWGIQQREASFGEQRKKKEKLGDE